MMEKTLESANYYRCKKHGLRMQEKCTICIPICDGCGEYIELNRDIVLEKDPHALCDQETHGFFLKNSPDSIS